MVLVDATGTPLAGDDDSGGSVNALILNYVLPADGQYSLVVGHSLGGFTGHGAGSVRSDGCARPIAVEEVRGLSAESNVRLTC